MSPAAVTIVAAVPGRVRLAVPGLKRSPALGRLLEARLGALPEIHGVHAEPRTGRVLVRQDRERPAGDLRGQVADLLAGLQLPRAADAPAEPSAREDAGEAPAPGTEGSPWHARAPPEVVSVLGTDAERGLDPEEAHRRLQRWGPNALAPPRQRSLLSLMSQQVASPPVALLGVSAAVAIATGGLLDAAAILVVVGANTVIGAFTERQTQRTIGALGRLEQGTAQARRDGQAVEIGAADLVPGDLLELRPGVQIPADARLLHSHRLSLDESSLTGESAPVRKSADAPVPADAPVAERRNMVYTGTAVTGGSGRAVVVATGARSELGHIQALAGANRPPPTPMESQLESLGRRLALLSVGVCAVVAVAGLLRGYGWLAMLRASLSLAVAAVPEGLPAVATSTLALGIRDMRRRHVLIRQLNAVETLGALQVLCLDKTGTLTENRMTVVAVHLGGRLYRRRDEAAGGGFVGEAGADVPEDLAELARSAALCSEVDADGNAAEGSPTESALLALAREHGPAPGALHARHPRRHLQHRSQDRPYMVSVHDMPDGGQLVAVKGAPERVLERCSSMRIDGREQPLDEAARQAIVDANDRLAGEALRVLGVACRAHGETGEAPHRDLVWLGLAGMADPLRPGMRELLDQLARAGIERVMITGDQSSTAEAIGRQLGLGDDGHLEVLESRRLDQMEPDVLAGVVSGVDVYARVSPAHKLAIVQALQRGGKVVAMTGDGVNDSPALKVADIGVALGSGGTEVARNVADVVVEDDDLRTLVEAIRQGRGVYDNIRKALRFLLATNLSEIEVMLAGVSLGLEEPLSPMQLLWINLVSDIAPALALALEPAERDVMQRPPRAPDAPIIANTDLRRLGVEATAITAGALAVYGLGIWRHGAGPRARTLAFTSLTTGQLLHTLVCRSETHSALVPGALPRNRVLGLSLGISLAAQVLTVTVPPLRRLLGTTPLGLVDVLLATGGAVAPLAFNEITKLRRARGPTGGTAARPGRQP